MTNKEKLDILIDAVSLVMKEVKEKPTDEQQTTMLLLLTMAKDVAKNILKDTLNEIS